MWRIAILIFLGSVYSATPQPSRIWTPFKCKNIDQECPCGSSSAKIAISIKQCPKHEKGKVICGNCPNYDINKICTNYTQCSECNDVGCTRCPTNKSGKFCTETCQCQNGGTCNLDGTCQCPSSYRGSLCEMIQCPYDAPSGNVQMGIKDGGSTATYTCQLGHSMPTGANNVRTCSNDGIWSGVVPTCLKQCPSLDLTEGLTSNPDTKNLQWYIPSTTFKCSSNLNLVGPNTINCLSDGKWDKAPPRCGASCSTPPHPTNGQANFQTGILIEGSMVTYSCAQNFKLVGSQEATCTDGSWSDNTPTCECECKNGGTCSSDGKCLCTPEFTGPQCQTSKCLNPEVKANTDVSTTGNDIGSIATYTCQVGYSTLPQTNHLRNCQTNGKWSGDAPTCLKACPHLDLLGQLVADQDTRNSKWYINTITFTCPPNFTLRGSTSINCLPNGQWDNQPPACVGPCPKPTTLDNGQAFYQAEDLLDGGKVKYLCNSGYSLSGAKEVNCQNGSWSQPTPTCMAKCSIPAPLDNGFASHSLKTILHGDKVKYSCNKGFLLVGQVESTCSSSGAWSQPPPKCECQCKNGGACKSDGSCSCLPRYTGGQCEKMRCLDPNVKPNSDVSFTGNDVGSTATYTCKQEYSMSAQTNTSRICQADGQWSGEAPDCRKRCPQLNLLGSLVSDPDTRNSQLYIKSTTFKCQPTFSLTGPKVINCLPNGKWDNTPPRCVAPCTTPLDLDNGHAYFRPQDLVEGGKVKFVCASGYVLKGAQEAICKSGSWSQQAPTCVTVCDTPDPLINGQATYPPRKIEEGDKVVYTCDQGYTLKGFQESICTDGAWTHPPPKCETACLDPVSIANADILVVNKQVGSTATYKCHAGYAMKPNTYNRVTCSEDGHWYGTSGTLGPLPKCYKMCQRLNLPQSVTADQDLANSQWYIRTINFNCPPNLSLEGPARINCLPNGQWDDQPPRCVSSCSAPQMVVNGQVNRKRGQLVEGDKVNFYCDHGYTLIGAIETICMNGWWTKPSPLCVPTCPDPPQLTNGNT